MASKIKYSPELSDVQLIYEHLKRIKFEILKLKEKHSARG